jgi:intracellular multiplication protein IcmJ
MDLHARNRNLDVRQFKAISDGLELIISIVRNAAHYRPNNPRREAADAEYKARRPAAMERGSYKCVFCGYVSRSNECHHVDGNHANNDENNHAVVDTFCHAYQHLGQQATQNPHNADSIGKKTVLAAVPELSPESLNLLQRAIGVALLDEREAKIAKAISKSLTGRTRPVLDAFGTFEPGDFAAAMYEMSVDAYEARASVVGQLRLLFHTEVLRHEGARFRSEFPTLPISSWEDVYRHAQSRFAR